MESFHFLTGSMVWKTDNRHGEALNLNYVCHYGNRMFLMLGFDISS